VPFTGAIVEDMEIVIVRSALIKAAVRNGIATPALSTMVNTGSAQNYKGGPS
jgi:hypothetical protein